MNKMIAFRTKSASGLLAVILAALLIQGCMDQANGSVNKDGKEEAKEVASIPVETAMVATGDVAAFYSGTTTIEADEKAVVVSQITGVVLDIYAEEGDFVTAGTVLAKVETDRYVLEVERSNATLKRLETELQRKKELFEKKLVSADDFERVSAEYDAQKASVGLARLNLKYTSIKAPISGYISERLVRAGNLVELHQAVYRITSYDPLLAILHVPERELSVLRKGLDVSVKLDALPDMLFTGEVIRISPVIDPATGTFRVTAEIRDTSQSLKPGLFGRVDILYDTKVNVPVIPRNAVVTEDENSHVFVVNEESNAVRRAVSLGYERNGLVEIIEGVSAGEQVVTAGKGSLSDGTKVEVVGLPENSPGV
jgi:membrane fusion protein (multidrug efflux system)